MTTETEVDLDGREVPIPAGTYRARAFGEPNIFLIGKATKMPNGMWSCLANVGGALCLVELRLTFHDSQARKATE